MDSQEFYNGGDQPDKVDIMNAVAMKTGGEMKKHVDYPNQEVVDSVSDQVEGIDENDPRNVIGRLPS